MSVTFSVPTLDERVWRTTEPGTSPPHQRLRAARVLVEAGVQVGIGMAPILPGLSDRPEQIAAVVRAAREAGVSGVWANLLYLRPGTREHFLEALARDWPEELARYERLYAGRAYLPEVETRPVRDRVRQLARAERLGSPRRPPRQAPPRDEQLRLAV